MDLVKRSEKGKKGEKKKEKKREKKKEENCKLGAQKLQLFLPFGSDTCTDLAITNSGFLTGPTNHNV